MRYKLSTLLLIFVLLGEALAMFREHWCLGLMLFLPHGLATGGSWVLFRRGKWRTASLLLILYFGAWLATANIGARAVEDRRARLMQEEMDSAPCRRLDTAWSFTTWPPPEGNWWYVTNETSPCPFVVRIDWGWKRGFGYGGDAYYLWCCCEPIWIGHSTYWHLGGSGSGWVGRPGS